MVKVKAAGSKPDIFLTGDRPTGALHLGHYCGSILNRLKIQDSGSVQYIMIADLQALTDHHSNPSKVVSSAYDLVADYIACGIDPQKTVIFLQSQIPELTELTTYFMNLVTLGRLQRNPTVKSEMQQKGYGSSVPAGFLCYPISQAADILAFKATKIPVGDDQLPMIEQTNEIVHKFNNLYNVKCFSDVTAVLSSHRRLIGIDGKSKASKSMNNAIFLYDSTENIKTKVRRMFTDPNHLKVDDPGSVDGNVVFAYLDAFYEDKDDLEKLKAYYQRGGLGDTTIKNLLNDVLQKFLMPIRERRASVSHNDIVRILREGCDKAGITAQNTMTEIRDAIGIKY